MRSFGVQSEVNLILEDRFGVGRSVTRYESAGKIISGPRICRSSGVVYQWCTVYPLVISGSAA